MEYVVQKAMENDLKKQLRNWKRKVDVAEMALKRERGILRSLLHEEKLIKGVKELEGIQTAVN